jgi:uncharacterized membrane protein YhaH (DUF805 family)
MRRRDWGQLFFSSTGRLDRRGYALTAAVLGVLTAAFHLSAAGPLERWTGWLVYAVVLFSAACVTSKRLHDLGRAGWWTFFPVFAAIAAWPQLDDSLDVAWAAFVTMVVAMLCALPGEARPNRFGPPPRGG